jgi:hypothetical protein
MRSSTGSKQKSRTKGPGKVLKATLTLSLLGSKAKLSKTWLGSPMTIASHYEALYQIQRLIEGWLYSDELLTWRIAVGAGSLNRSAKRSNSYRKTRRGRSSLLDQKSLDYSALVDRVKLGKPYSSRPLPDSGEESLPASGQSTSKAT